MGRAYLLKPPTIYKAAPRGKDAAAWPLGNVGAPGIPIPVLVGLAGVADGAVPPSLRRADVREEATLLCEFPKYLGAFIGA